MPITVTALSLPMTRLLEENPLPMLRDLDRDKALLDGGLLPGERPHFAQNTGFRVLPYRMQDHYEAQPTLGDVPLIVLENQRLRAAFLPTFGGRLWSLIDKDSGRECLYRNKDLRLGNLALRNAWFAGGIEWNYGHFGHTFFTCAPMFFARCRDRAGDEFLRMYEFERCHGTVFQVDFHLPPDAGALIVHMAMVNPSDAPAPLFLWTNTAVPEDGNPRIFSATDQVITQRAGPNDFIHGQLPGLGAGLDYTYPALIPHAQEYFFQNPPGLNFQATVYQDGSALIDRSTANFPYRKMFCWGAHPAGRAWQRQLCPSGEPYLEVQAGLARTQVHGAYLDPGAALNITQLYAPAFMDPEAVSGDYSSARRHVADAVDGALPQDLVMAQHHRCLAAWDAPTGELLFDGSGWGALENLRCPGYLPGHLPFPDRTLGNEQQPWRALLLGRPFPGASAYQTAQPWLDLMLRAQATPQLLLHRGIARIEQLARDQGEADIRASIAQCPTALGYRCLAYSLWQRGAFQEAASHMDKAMALQDLPQRAYAEEYLMMLYDAGRYEDAWAYYEGLPQALAQGERVALTAALSALALGKDDFVDQLVKRRFSVIREGERKLTDAWFRRAAEKEARRLGVPVTDQLLGRVMDTHPLPPHIDYRMS